jgi:hypothetical protein
MRAFEVGRVSPALIAAVACLMSVVGAVLDAQTRRGTRPTPRASTQQSVSLAGNYEGLYQCNSRWTAFTMTLTESGRGAVTADAVFPLRHVRPSRLRRAPRANEPVKMDGTTDSENQQVILSTNDELQLGIKGPERKVTMRGALDPTNGYLTGTMDYPGCVQFVLVPTTIRGSAEYAARVYANRVRRDETIRAREETATAAREARVADGWISPELLPSGGRIQHPEDPMTYVDDVMGQPTDPFQAVRPIDQLNQRLRDASYKCLSTTTVAWTGRQGRATTSHFRTKTYVVECDGDCSGVTYKIPLRGAHGGRSRPYPVITIASAMLVDQPFPWEFTRTQGAVPPRIRIHTWSNQLGDYGGGCRID